MKSFFEKCQLSGQHAVKTACVAAALIATPLSASAGIVFGVTPDALFSGATIPAGEFTSDSLLTSGSTLVSVVGPEAITGVGYVRAASFEGTNLAFGETSGLNTVYSLWGEFTYGASLIGGDIGTQGASYVITSLDFNLYAAAGGPTFTAADASTGTGGTVDTSGFVDGTDQDVAEAGDTLFRLGVGSLAPSFIAGSEIGSNADGNPFNATMLFDLTSAGELFFTAPNPFVNGASASLNNTSTQFIANSDLGVAAVTSGGTITFEQVPAPGGVALFSLGLLALGASLRGRRTRHIASEVA